LKDRGAPRQNPGTKSRDRTKKRRDRKKAGIKNAWTKVLWWRLPQKKVADMPKMEAPMSALKRKGKLNKKPRRGRLLQRTNKKRRMHKKRREKKFEKIRPLKRSK